MDVEAKGRGAASGWGLYGGVVFVCCDLCEGCCCYRLYWYVCVVSETIGVRVISGIGVRISLSTIARHDNREARAMFELVKTQQSILCTGYTLKNANDAYSAP